MLPQGGDATLWAQYDDMMGSMARLEEVAEPKWVPPVDTASFEVSCAASATLGTPIAAVGRVEPAAGPRVLSRVLQPV